MFIKEQVNMNEIFKFFYRVLYSVKLLIFDKVYVFGARFNRQTKFGGFNKVGKKSCVSGTRIGAYSYLGCGTSIPSSKIGAFCSIGDNVKVVSLTHPSSKFVSTSPVFFSTSRQCGTSFVVQDLFVEKLSVDNNEVIIGNDVWVGTNVLIKGGVKVGDGAIIAMGAVVTKDVPPYAIIGGVPAELIKYRFSKEEIDFLLNLEWWNKDIDWIKKNVSNFHDIEYFKDCIG